VRLPQEFKELQSRNVAPIMIKNSDTSASIGFFPVRIITKAEIRRINSKNTGFNTIPTLPVWIEWEDAVPFIKIDAVAGEDLIYEVSYFKYWPPLQAPTEENPITVSYPKMIYARARQEIFEDINDPIQVIHEKIAEREFKTNKNTDDYRKLHGQDLRM